MPFVIEHVRLTNSSKVPDVFLTCKVQLPSDTTEKSAGKLFFVLEIDQPWNHVATIGSSVLNMITREYYRYEGTVPLENFERAIAKANHLLEQLMKEGEAGIKDSFHALIGLTVGDEFHLAYTGAAEAYFLRDEKISLITEPGSQKAEGNQIFAHIISGELSTGDIIFLGSPTIYQAFTSDELEHVLVHPIDEAAREVARRLKTHKIRAASAIILRIDSVANVENQPLHQLTETVYLDQPIDSFWSTFLFYAKKIGRPLGTFIVSVSKDFFQALGIVGRSLKQFSQKVLVPKSQRFFHQTGQSTNKVLETMTAKTLPAFKEVGHLLRQIQPNKLALPSIKGNKTDPAITVHHYINKRRTQSLVTYLLLPVQFLQSLGSQFRQVIRRSPRTWYIIIALILLSSIGASIQTHRKKPSRNPVLSAATLTTMKQALVDANKAKAFGDMDKARRILLTASLTGEQAKQNPKLQKEAASILGDIERELDNLAGITRLPLSHPLLHLTDEARLGTIYEGILYYTTSDGKIKSLLLTGGEPTLLAELPDAQAIHELTLDQINQILYLQTPRGSLYQLALATSKLKSMEPKTGSFPVATGLAWYNDNLYLVDPAASQIWRYPLVNNQFGEPAPYLKSKKVVLTDTISEAIDGSVFTLSQSGKVQKFVRGNLQNWQPASIPSPFETIVKPLGFFAIEDGAYYYLVDRGNATISSRIIELDKTGKFLHQYFLPRQWQKDIKLVMANPKSHKAWILVNNDLYEFTLVQ